MCDYSLAVLPNRLAVEGEELVVHRFYTGARGLAPPADLRAPEPPPSPAPRKSVWQWLKNVFEDPQHANVTAVCVPPGAHLLLKDIPGDFQRQWRIGNEQNVLFVQLGANENQFRDAVQFPDGRHVLLQELHDGMSVRVLSLGGEERNDEPEFGSQSLESAGASLQR